MKQEVQEVSQEKKEEDHDQSKLFGEVVEFVSKSTSLSLLTSKDRDFLLSPTGTQQVKVADLEDKVIGIYFSANWCLPCRDFTQILANSYNHIRDTGSQFEVVFVSSDEDLNAFKNYHSLMPWLAIPFSDLESKKSLSRRFDVEGIPCLVILQPNRSNAAAVFRDGVDVIYRYGVSAFPFTDERLEELKREEKERYESQTLVILLANRDRDSLLGHPAPNQVPVNSLTGKTVGLYFTAQWCLPGVKFSQKLISIYHKIKGKLLAENKDDDFEIVLVSTDRDQAEFNAHFNTLPWLALPFGDPDIKALTKYFDIQGIPSLVILGPDGKTVTKHGRKLINLYQENAYPFTEARVELLEKRMDEEAKSLPTLERHAGHHHDLSLVSEGSGGGPFICCDCDEQGSGWAYQCIQCGYEIHPKCVKALEIGPIADA